MTKIKIDKDDILMLAAEGRITTQIPNLDVEIGGYTSTKKPKNQLIEIPRNYR